jgi:hypothetical protein
MISLAALSVARPDGFVWQACQGSLEGDVAVECPGEVITE